MKNVLNNLGLQMPTSPTVYALHGFLGLPTDWHTLSQNKFNVIAPNLTTRHKPGKTLWEFAKDFNESVSRNNSSSHVLLGYSMGGRLAMHALLQNPSLWDAAIIVSADPGLLPEAERPSRLQHDEHWAMRFESDPWELLMRDWNSQPIFRKDKTPFLRNENDYSRQILADILRNWSQCHQKNLLPMLAKLTIPVLYVAGELDCKYTQIAKICAAAHSSSQLWIAPEASHRVPWQQPELFQQKSSQFLKGICT